jgi:hypothetical protein
MKVQHLRGTKWELTTKLPVIPHSSFESGPPEMLPNGAG